MNYVTSNIRIPEQDYLRLKEEAAKWRKSLAAVVRQKLRTGSITHFPEDAGNIMVRIGKLARKNAKRTKGFDSVKALREIRKSC